MRDPGRPHGPHPHRPRHHVQVVDVVTGRRGHGVVAPWHEDTVAVRERERLIQAAIVAVHALESETSPRRDAVVVRFLQGRFRRRIMAVVLVGWVARPMARRGDDLNHQQRLGLLVVHQDRVDRPLESAVAARLRLDLRCREHACRGAAPSRCPAQGHLCLRARRSADAEGGARREVGRVRRTRPRILPVADGVPRGVLGVDVDRAGDHHHAHLALAGVAFGDRVAVQAQYLKPDVLPSRRRGSHAQDGSVIGRRGIGMDE